MKRSEELQIEELENELADLYTMSEEAARFRYNVDYKQEAIDSLTWELDQLYAKLKPTIQLADISIVDEAFASIEEFDRMRV